MRFDFWRMAATLIKSQVYPASTLFLPESEAIHTSLIGGAQRIFTLRRDSDLRFSRAPNWQGKGISFDYFWENPAVRVSARRITGPEIPAPFFSLPAEFLFPSTGT